jgi:glutamate-5-semialdehyde dehydrogenase
MIAIAQSEATAKATLARVASRRMASTTTDQKNDALNRIADALITESERILAINKPEVQRGRDKGLTDAFIDRMVLTRERLLGIADDARKIAALPDPVGEMIEMSTRPNGLQIGRTRVPLGVIGAIYESRPNVTVDIAALCLKAGNTVVLRSGTDAHESSAVLAEIIAREAEAAGMPSGVVQFIDSTDRAEVSAMLAAHESIDLMVPRGGADLIQRVVDEAKMPVVAGGIGVCHTYIDSEADLDMAREIAVNAKVKRPSVCNAMDTLLVHADVAERFIPDVARAMHEHGVTLHTDDRVGALLDGGAGAAVTVAVTPEDYDREWLSLDCSVLVVDSVDEALSHIDVHGSGHSEAIVTDSYPTAQRFQLEADAAAVFVNASTYFHDGAQFGLGAELGISTQRMHARGPIGLRELTSYKWLVLGSGHTRD